MVCTKCRKELTRFTQTYKARFKGTDLAITNMPMLKCECCGEKYLPSESAVYLDSVLAYCANSDLQSLTVEYPNPIENVS